jgi:hypothetical protein
MEQLVAMEEDILSLQELGIGEFTDAAADFMTTELTVGCSMGCSTASLTCC